MHRVVAPSSSFPIDPRRSVCRSGNLQPPVLRSRCKGESTRRNRVRQAAVAMNYRKLHRSRFFALRRRSPAARPMERGRRQSEANIGARKKCTGAVAPSSGFPTDLRRSECRSGDHQPPVLLPRCNHQPRASRSRRQGGSDRSCRNLRIFQRAHSKIASCASCSRQVGPGIRRAGSPSSTRPTDLPLPRTVARWGFVLHCPVLGATGNLCCRRHRDQGCAKATCRKLRPSGEGMARRHIVVTGAGTGIGHAIARRLDRDGASLTLIARDRTRLERVAATLAQPSHVVACDIRDRGKVEKAFAGAVAELGPVHALVACSGIGGANGGDGKSDRFDDLVATNLNGTYYCCRAALAHLAPGPEPRHLVVLSSILARIAVPGYTGYSAAKAGLLGLVRSFAAELGEENVQVNAICPGWVDTDMAWSGLDGIAAAEGGRARMRIATRCAPCRSAGCRSRTTSRAPLPGFSRPTRAASRDRRSTRTAAPGWAESEGRPVGRPSVVVGRSGATAFRSRYRRARRRPPPPSPRAVRAPRRSPSEPAP